MPATETLTSLAMLKVNIDQGSDYLDYLKPFVLQLLIEHGPGRITEEDVRTRLRAEYGLEIPQRTVQIVLKRIARKHALKREEHSYYVVGVLPDPGMARHKAEAERHITAIANGLVLFASKSSHSLSPSDAVEAICSFLSEFNVQCLRAYLRGSAIPSLDGNDRALIVLVSDYVLYLQQNDPERFASFLVLVQGHMLANALLCPDLLFAPKSYKEVAFYLDTPLIIQHLGLEGDAKQRAANELVTLLKRLGGTVSVFSHSREELDRVVKGAANHLGSRDARSAIVFEARRRGTTKSDLLLLAAKIDGSLEAKGIEIRLTPEYRESVQIDEAVFEQILDDEVNYFNPRAREYDVNSVRSIYALRANRAPRSLEKSKAVLVTSNAGFAHAAYTYGQRHEEMREVSSVITDFTLANIAWLKAPVGAPAVPRVELLAYSYAALRPSPELLDSYMREIDRLESQGKISEQDHQLLRSSIVAQEEVMRYTLGDASAVTEEAVSVTLQRVTKDLQKEERALFQGEENAHKQTRDQLATVTDERNALQSRLFWSCKSRARILSRIILIVAYALVSVGLVASFHIRTKNPLLGWALMIGAGFVFLLSVAGMLWGISVHQLHLWLQRRLLRAYLHRESKATGIDFETQS